ncbi:arsenic resistance N-acetyltransferase ArsN2 [Halorarum salinum]|uniref:GNAT family N-acetyltransferase n=1 Tax=Halorarum salinum TaxID=2743089 RepID=A0A7D5LA90_9EURY|nr:arsenic resistance N-acetyltransferase ArsN2 [Halobaculum salinum]QLG61667.1 GNAT family N-acetyltransferase [Halobaculum salinum]
MTDPSIVLREADADDLDRVEATLEANDLPHRDVRTSPGRFFLARSDGERVGVGGVEIRGSNGLLRSVVVEESSRGRGYGAALCEALEDYARGNGAETLYLLTTTAPGFFRGRGYVEVDREDVPSSVRATTEFADLCPASATCMGKRLDG